MFDHLPWLATAIIVPALFTVLACTGHVVVHRSFPKADFLVHNEVAGFVIAIVGVLYAVMLGFLTVIVWERYSLAENGAQQEAGVAEDIWRLGHGLPQPARRRILLDIGGYTHAVAAHEWSSMDSESPNGSAAAALDTIFTDVTTARIDARDGGAIEGLLLERLDTLNDLRTRRLASDRTGVPGILYFSMIAGAVLVIAFEYLFGMKNFRVQLCMTAATAIMIGLLFSVVVKLDVPFRGAGMISPEHWTAMDRQMSNEMRR